MKNVQVSLPILFLLFMHCASIKTEGIRSSVGSELAEPDTIPKYPPYFDEQLRIQVVQFKISAEIGTQYPQLAEKQVGLGLSNRIVDELYETRRFKFVEEKAEMQAKIMAQWALSQSGIITENQQISSEGISAPQYLVYAELIDFSISNSEAVKGISLEKRATTRISFQIRLLNVSTGEFIPASGTGEATSVATSLWVNPQLPFDQSTVGLATLRATRNAVLQLINRMNL